MKKQTAEKPVRKRREPSQARLTPNARTVLEARYLARDAEGQISETPGELFERVARAIAEAEALYENEKVAAKWKSEYVKLLGSLEFLPNSPTLMNAGMPEGQLSACFVLPIENSLESIFDTIKNSVKIHLGGGGTGYAFSRIPARSEAASRAEERSPGPVSYLRIFDAISENIGWRARRGIANMGTLRVDHPDILDFIRAKLDGKSLANFNLSVALSDTFMTALSEGRDFALSDPVTGDEVDRVRPEEIFDALVEAAWLTGDPGVIFIDVINRDNPAPEIAAIETTNPCGEIPLAPYESCNLGSINLARMLQKRAGRYQVDWKKLRSTVQTAVQFLDDVIVVNAYPLDEIKYASLGSRKIGLGVMGFAEMLARVEIPYDSDAAVELGDKVMGSIQEEAHATSGRLAIERGCFTGWAQSRLCEENIRRRNATLTAIAPTGSISILAGTSPSIEPLFALACQRSHVLDGETLSEVSPVFLEALKTHDLKAEPLLAEIYERGSLGSIRGLPASLKNLFKTATEIPLERHIAIQAAFQKHTDNAVSKTINLPATAERGDVAHAFKLAWESGLKGITVFRQGCRDSQVLGFGLPKGSARPETESTTARALQHCEVPGPDSDV